MWLFLQSSFPESPGTSDTAKVALSCALSAKQAGVGAPAAMCNSTSQAQFLSALRLSSRSIYEIAYQDKGRWNDSLYLGEMKHRKQWRSMDIDKVTTIKQWCLMRGVSLFSALLALLHLPLNCIDDRGRTWHPLSKDLVLVGCFGVLPVWQNYSLKSD